MQNLEKPPGQVHMPLTMSALTFIGGAIGYWKARSIPSLVVGVSFGTTFAIGGWLINSGDGREGHTLSLGASSLLTAAMGGRYYKTRSMIPSGLLLGAGTVSAIYHAISVRDWL